MKDYSELTSRIYVQLEPELSQEFHNMLTEIAQELSRLYEIEKEYNELKERDRFNAIGKSIQYCKNEVVKWN